MGYSQGEPTEGILEMNKEGEVKKEGVRLSSILREQGFILSRGEKQIY